jgi:HSP20 family protein
MSQVLPERQAQGAEGEQRRQNEIELLNERIRRILDQTFTGLGLPSPLSEATGWAPPVDIEERDDAYVFQAELPGVEREDVNIELVGNELQISGEIKEREREGILRKRTRKVGQFEYRVVLPDQVDAERVEAKLNDGVLTVQVPKANRAQRRRIEVGK